LFEAADDDKVELMKRSIRRLVDALGQRSRLVYGGLAAATAVVMGVVARRRAFSLDLPDPGELAAETAESVRNAARGTVITTIREADSPDIQLVKDTGRGAVADAARSGADITSVAIGVVEGAAEIAHLVDTTPRELVPVIARTVVSAAEAQGVVAGARVADLLSHHLTPTSA
jgi:hypothetical protein